MGVMVQVLGRVELDDGEADRALGRGQARELLALLVARRGAPISTAQIVDALWPAAPPATVTTIVHGLVRRIRKSLGPEALVFDDAGYRLDVPATSVDLWAIDAALEAGDLAGAREQWKEPAFGAYSTRSWALDAASEIAARLRPGTVEVELLRVRKRIPVNRLVGRRRELSAVAAACRRARLVTIVGLGGVGKTRLAFEASRQLDFPSVIHVDVGAAAGPAASRLSAELGQGTSGEPEADLRAIASLIGRSHQLLLMDGCEHDLAGSAHVIEYLLGSCPDLSVIATSRLVLGVPGEHVIPLMPFTDAADPRGDAVELLLDRAHGRGLLVTAADREAAAEICRRCAGVPLAIELGVSELVFGHSTGAGPGPHVTPEEAVDDVVEKALAQLSGPTATTARRAALLVAGFTPDLTTRLSDDPTTATGIFHELVASGLVVAETSGRSRRLRFLDRVRDALKERATPGDHEISRHAVMSIFESVRPALGGPVAIPNLVIALGEIANADALIQAERDAEHWETVLSMVIAMSDAWAEDGQWVRGVTNVSEALAAAPHADPYQRALAVRALGAVSGTYNEARRLAVQLTDALVVAREAGDDALQGHLLLHLANAYGYDGRVADALQCVSELAALGQSTGSEYIQIGAESLGALGRLLTGDPVGAQPILVELARRLLALGSVSDAARMNRSASVAYRTSGDIDRALDYLILAEELALTAHARGTLATIRTDIADLRTQQGAPDAGAALEAALTTVLAVGNIRAAGILRTRIGALDDDHRTTALGALDLWHADRRWAAASLAVLLEQLPRTHVLQSLGPSVIAALDGEWGTPLDAAEAKRVAPFVAAAGTALPADWPAVVEQHLIDLVAAAS